jgi:flagellar biosynthesis protein FlhG
MQIHQKAVTDQSVTASRGRDTKALTISIISNKGGVGKTHLAINLAYALGKTGARVLLIDGDLGNADISNKLSIFPEKRLKDFLEKKQDIEDLVFSTNYNFDLISSSSGDLSLANLYYAQKIKFINKFKHISSNYDITIFDLGAGISRTVIDIALAADHTVIVTTPRDLISGYACAKAAFSRFKEIERNLKVKLHHYDPSRMFSPMFVINQVSCIEHGGKLYEKIKNTAERNMNNNGNFFSIKPEYLGPVLYDHDSLRTVEQKRRPLLYHFPNMKVSRCIQNLSTRFVNSEDHVVKHQNRFLNILSMISSLN